MTQRVTVIGVPTDFGANRRGVDMGPSAIRYAGLLESLMELGIGCHDLGDVSVPAVGEIDRSTLDLSPARRVCDRLKTQVSAALERGETPLILGGDHSIAAGSVAGSAQVGRVGLLWLDAHADCNTPETSPSGNAHGMPLAALLGLGSFHGRDWGCTDVVEPKKTALVGLRDVDHHEGEEIAASDITTFTMSDIDRDGIAAVCRQALDVVTTDVDVLHVSLDLDLLDPLEAPGVGTPVRGGVSYREAHLSMELVASALEGVDVPLVLDLVEVNPVRDEVNETAVLAVELAASALGKRILPK